VRVINFRIIIIIIIIIIISIIWLFQKFEAIRFKWRNCFLFFHQETESADRVRRRFAVTSFFLIAGGQKVGHPVDFSVRPVSLH